MVLDEVSVGEPEAKLWKATRMLLSGVGIGLMGEIRPSESPHPITTPMDVRTLLEKNRSTNKTSTTSKTSQTSK
jgi:hypothetical protein